MHLLLLCTDRGANGVIIITTKKGRLNAKPKVNVTSLIGVSSSAVKFHEVLKAEDFMKYTAGNKKCKNC